MCLYEVTFRSRLIRRMKRHNTSKPINKLKYVFQTCTRREQSWRGWNALCHNTSIRCIGRLKMSFWTAHLIEGIEDSRIKECPICIHAKEALHSEAIHCREVHCLHASLWNLSTWKPQTPRMCRHWKDVRHYERSMSIYRMRSTRSHCLGYAVEQLKIQNATSGRWMNNLIKVSDEDSRP